jgi:hypothetical protein
MKLNRLVFISAFAALLSLGLQACGAGSEDEGATANTTGSGAGGGLLPDGGLASGNGGSSGTGSGSGSSGTGSGSAEGGLGSDPLPDGSLGDPTVPTFDFGDGGIAACSGDGCPQCANGEDDDGDGKIDGFDEECTGPVDNDEGSFATGIPGDNRDPKWQDCFFDGNSGAGDDGCRYHTECLTGDRPLTDNSCVLTDQCVEFCRPLVPNGCDCFGCCEVGTDAGSVFVQINTGCDFDDIGDETLCPRCVQTTQCLNTCGECELCPGKGIDDLPDNCVGEPPGGDGDTTPPPGEDGGSNPPPPPPPNYTCDGGEQVCVSSSDCDAGFYCQFGCCVKSVIF